MLLEDYYSDTLQRVTHVSSALPSHARRAQEATSSIKAPATTTNNRNRYAGRRIYLTGCLLSPVEPAPQSVPAHPTANIAVKSSMSSQHERDSLGHGTQPNSNPRRGYDDNPVIFPDSLNVMLYSPLLPTRDSLVELADSEAVAEDRSDHAIPEPEIPGWSWSNTLPLAPVSTSGSAQTPPSHPIGSNSQSLSTRTHEQRPQAQATRVWIPSKDQLSIQCMWWGYRMYVHLFSFEIPDTNSRQGSSHLPSLIRSMMHISKPPNVPP